MPRRNRFVAGGYIYHVINRANAREQIFHKPEDYLAFERVWREANVLHPLPLLGYCIMPNHFYAVVWPPKGDDELVSRFMHWMTMTHTQRYHQHYHTVGNGHLYQARFKAFPIETERYLYHVLRYVERNALRANLASEAEDWRWSSLWKYYRGKSADGLLLTDWPVPRPSDWLKLVNTPQSEAEEQAIRKSVQRGRPYGSESWTEQTVKALGLEHTMRSVGRPRKDKST